MKRLVAHNNIPDDLQKGDVVISVQNCSCILYKVRKINKVTKKAPYPTVNVSSVSWNKVNRCWEYDGYDFTESPVDILRKI